MCVKEKGGLGFLSHVESDGGNDDGCYEADAYSETEPHTSTRCDTHLIPIRGTRRLVPLFVGGNYHIPYFGSRLESQNRDIVDVGLPDFGHVHDLPCVPAVG